MFSLVEGDGLVGLNTYLWGIYHQLTSSLANSVRAELNGLELKHHSFSFFREIVSFEVATTKSTLSHHAL